MATARPAGFRIGSPRSSAAAALLLASSLAALRIPAARAVEVSLEENKAERGNIGYVDLQLLFRQFPDTQKAKQNFEEVVRQAEDQVNLKKAEILGLRAELARLRVEREYVAKNPLTPPPPAPAANPALPGFENRSPSFPESAASTAPASVPLEPSSAPARGAWNPEAPPTSSTQAVSGPTPGVPGSTAAAASPPAVAESASGGPAVSGSTRPAAAQAAGANAEPAPLIINLPGISPETAPLAPPGASSTTTAAAVNPALAALDARIAEAAKALEGKEAEFKTYQAQVEKNLLDLEGKRTEILLGRIYGAVREVARAEGVSVVVDKSQILFGHKAVDLTDKVLDKLKTL